MKQTTSSSGIGLLGAVFIVFLIMKLAEVGKVAEWSWWWVTSPLWIPFLLSIGIMLIYLIYSLIMLFFRRKRFRGKYGDGGKTESPPPVKKSKWQERLEELAKQQQQAKEKRQSGL